MAKIKDLIAYLERNGIAFEVVSHTPAFSAHHVATAVHAPDRTIAKTLMVQADDRFVMAVLPADHRLDEHALRTQLGAHKLHLAHEEDLTHLFPDCETGAMPPFGNLYALPVFVDSSLANDEEIVFNACTHTNAIRMRTADYLRLVRPFVGPLTKTRALMEEP
jgi:Ala-tRNA(Pro) deacylase